MNSFDLPGPNPDEIPVDPGTQKRLRRGLLLIALATLLGSCGLCWYSSRIESLEGIYIPLIAAIVIAFYSAYQLYQREQNQDLAPALWRVGSVFMILILFLGGLFYWLVSAAGWQTGPGLILSGLSALGLFLAGRRVWESWSFSRRGILEECDQVKLEMISIRGSHPIYPQLSYLYGGKYRGKYQNEKIHDQLQEVQSAVEAGKLRVTVKYLPDRPRVQRVEGWKIVG